MSLEDKDLQELKYFRDLISAAKITKEDLENLLQAYSSNRVLILPYAPGDVVYVLKYPLYSNRMYPAEVYLNSLADVIDLMFSHQQVYPTYAQASRALDEMYREV